MNGCKKLPMIAAIVGSIALSGCTTPVEPNNGTALTNQLHDQLPSGPAQADAEASVRVNTQLAAAYLQAGRLDVAKEVIGRALAANPDSALALAVQGLIFGESRDLAKADDSFRRALKIAPEDPDLNHNYATYLCRTGRADSSTMYFDKALKTHGYARATASKTGLATCLLKLQKTATAEGHFRDVLALEPTNGSALLGMAEISLGRREFRSARDYLGKYSSSHSVSAQFLWLSSELERLVGNRTEAHGLASDLARLFPTSEQARTLIQATVGHNTK